MKNQFNATRSPTPEKDKAAKHTFKTATPKKKAKIVTLNDARGDKQLHDKFRFMLDHILSLATRATADARSVTSMSEADTAQTMMIAGKVLVCYAAGQLDSAGLSLDLIRKVDSDTAEVAHRFAQGAL